MNYIPSGTTRSAGLSTFWGVEVWINWKENVFGLQTFSTTSRQVIAIFTLIDDTKLLQANLRDTSAQIILVNIWTAIFSDYLAVKREKLTTLSRHNLYEADENSNINTRLPDLHKWTLHST